MIAQHQTAPQPDFQPQPLLTKFRRLDKQLIDRGLVATPQRAQELIVNGAVRVNGAVITATQCPVNPEHLIEISGIDCPWVSADALKLFEAIKATKLDVRGRVAVNLGAGIGGFEDVLLQNGAKKIYAVEQESALLHHSLSLNPRIKNLQRVAAKDVTEAHIEKDFSLIVADIGTDNLVENLKPVLSVIEEDCNILLFASDKKALKDVEKTLRLDYALMIKRVPDAYQKVWDAKGSHLVWLQKKI